MLAEAIHSVVDTTNQALLLYGLRRANKPADEKHPFGYGTEVYFWAFVVAIMIFGVGAGFSIYEGVQKLLDPHDIKNPYINYIVLTLAIIFESVAWWIAYTTFEKTRGRRSFLAELRHSKDPTVFTVLFEDTAALLGLFIAFVGVLAVHLLGWQWMDGLATLLIGMVLAITAVLLIIETKGLLIGEAAAPGVEQSIRKMAMDLPEVRTINELLTLHLGPRDLLVTLSVEFAPGLMSERVEASISNLEAMIKARHEEVSRVFIEAQSFASHLRALKELEARGQED